jgi:chorismate mutase
MKKNDLENIRSKIDVIDTQIHNLIIERAEILADVIKVKKIQTQEQNSHFYRPSREAEILRTLLKNHKGDLPHATIIAIWRTLLSSFCILQGDFSVAYCSPKEPESLRDLVRYYFSSIVRLKKSATELSVLHAVSSKDVTLGVVPIYSEDDIDEWWLNMPTGIYASGMLPFVQNDHISHVQQDYVILSWCLPEATDHDKTLLKITATQDIGRGTVTSFINKLDYKPKSLSTVNPKLNDEERYHLFELDGYINMQQLEEFSKSLKKISANKILDVSYLGSFPAPLDMHGLSKQEVF